MYIIDRELWYYQLRYTIMTVMSIKLYGTVLMTYLTINLDSELNEKCIGFTISCVCVFFFVIAYTISIRRNTPMYTNLVLFR